MQSDIFSTCIEMITFERKNSRFIYGILVTERPNRLQVHFIDRALHIAAAKFSEHPSMRSISR